MKTIKIITAICLIAILAIGASGCQENVGVSNEEAIEIIEKLFVSVNEINRIHYGEGINHVSDESDNAYADVYPDERYKSLEDIEDFTRRIFTKDLADITLASSFGETDGIVDREPRYISVKYQGEVKLLIRKDIEPLTEIYEYDLTNIEILGTAQGIIEAKIGTTTSKTKRFVLKQEENGWRIDTPTY